MRNRPVGNNAMDSLMMDPGDTKMFFDGQGVAVVIVKFPAVRRI